MKAKLKKNRRSCMCIHCKKYLYFINILCNLDRMRKTIEYHSLLLCINNWLSYLARVNDDWHLTVSKTRAHVWYVLNIITLLKIPILRPNRQYKASTAEMAEVRYSYRVIRVCSTHCLDLDLNDQKKRRYILLTFRKINEN